MIPDGYSLETIDAPAGADRADVPDGAMLEAGGLAVRDDGTVLAGTRQGRIWEYDPDADDWSLFTNSLHMALGIWPDEETGGLYTVERSALSRVVDTDDDGWADSFETIADDWGNSNNYHEYAFGPVRDSEGNFYLNLNMSDAPIHGPPYLSLDNASEAVDLPPEAGNPPEAPEVDAYDTATDVTTPDCERAKGSVMGVCAPYRGWMIKVTPDGEFVPFAPGQRSPCGLGITEDDEIFYTDNQGDYVPTCHLTHVEEGDFLGHPAALVDHPDWQDEDFSDYPEKVYDLMRTEHAAWVPYAQANSLGGVTVDQQGEFGPFEGQMFMGDQTIPKLLRVSLDEVGGHYQGAVFNFVDGLQCGTIRESFSPDGQGLYLGQTDRGWASAGNASFGLQQLTYDGETTPFEMRSVELQESGFEIEFTEPVDTAAASDPANYSISHWTYDNNVGYGSNKMDQTTVDSANVQVTVKDGGQRVHLELPEIYITPNYASSVMGGTRLYEIVLNGVESAGGTRLENDTTWYTVNNRPEPQRAAPADRALGIESTVQFPGESPSNAQVLWDGEDHTLGTDWEHTDGSQPQWNETDDYFEVNLGTGDIRTTEDIGDCHLHVEWRVPEDVEGGGQQRGNSGVFLMQNYEVQVLDTYENDTYAAGWAGSHYGEAAPMTSPLRPPGEWQSYDIIWRGPRWEDTSRTAAGGFASSDDDPQRLVRPATITVLVNGTVVVFNHRVGGAVTGGEGSGNYSPHPPELPLQLQDHGQASDKNTVQFRNVWYQSLPDEEQQPVVVDQPTYSTEYGAKHRGMPTRISPGGPGTASPPSDAEYLLEGGSLDGWEHVGDGPPAWTERDGFVEAAPGASDIRTTKEVGDGQFHLEWRVPEGGEDAGVGGESGSGVLVLDRYKLQLEGPDGESIDLEEWPGAYPDQEQPRVNATREPGEWQTLDVAWQAPRFEDGELVQRARADVLLNGAAVQARLIPEGPNVDGTVGEYEPHAPEGPLRLEGADGRVQFRDVWYRSFEVTNENRDYK